MPFPMFSGGGGEPGTPVGVSASAGNTNAIVFFTPPDYLGKATVTYSVTSTPATSTQIFSASGQTFTGLSNGTSYTFVVRTLTDYSVYSEPSAASSAITPVAPPPSFGPVFPPDFPPVVNPCAGVTCGDCSNTAGYSSQYVVGGPGELGVCGTCTGVPMYVYTYSNNCCGQLFCWTGECIGCPPAVDCGAPTGNGWSPIANSEQILDPNISGSPCGGRGCEYSLWRLYSKPGCTNYNLNYSCANCPGDNLYL